MAPDRILVVRLGAMGDVIHTLPAVHSLKLSFPHAHIAWTVHPRWTDLLRGGGVVDELIPFNRREGTSIRKALRCLREHPFDLGVDFQGLVQSSLVLRAARAQRRIGFDAPWLREKPAAWLYSECVAPESRHVVEMNLDLARHAGAKVISAQAPLPPGVKEGAVPDVPFVLASPFAGWQSKQWPLECWAELAQLLRQRLGLMLVLNGSPRDADALRSVAGAHVHLSSIAGLIDITRRASAVVGVDSGPMHLAAALARPGVAIFGPTDPVRNGPYSKTFRVLRDPAAVTTYKRENEISEAMRAIEPHMVVDAVEERLRAAHGDAE